MGCCNSQSSGTTSRENTTKDYNHGKGVSVTSVPITTNDTATTVITDAQRLQTADHVTTSTPGTAPSTYTSINSNKSQLSFQITTSNKANDKVESNEMQLDTEESIDNHSATNLNLPRMHDDVVSNVIKSIIVPRYIDNNYTCNNDKYFPIVLIQLIDKYLKFIEPKKLYFEATDIKEIMTTCQSQIKNVTDGFFHYNKKQNHLKIHCYGDCLIQRCLSLNGETAVPPKYSNNNYKADDIALEAGKGMYKIKFEALVIILVWYQFFNY